MQYYCEPTNQYGLLKTSLKQSEIQIVPLKITWGQDGAYLMVINTMQVDSSQLEKVTLHHSDLERETVHAERNSLSKATT